MHSFLPTVMVGESVWSDHNHGHSKQRNHVGNVKFEKLVAVKCKFGLSNTKDPKKRAECLQKICNNEPLSFVDSESYSSDNGEKEEAIDYWTLIQN